MYILQADDYKLGNCGIRWAFALAIIALFDVTILGCLAYTLATKKIKEWILGPHLMTCAQTCKFCLALILYKSRAVNKPLRSFTVPREGTY